MTTRLTRNKNLVRVCALSTPKVRKRLIAYRDCCKNILAGNIDLQPKEKQKLFRHKASVRHLGRAGWVSLKQSRVILQRGIFFHCTHSHFEHDTQTYCGKHI